MRTRSSLLPKLCRAQSPGERGTCLPPTCPAAPVLPHQFTPVPSPLPGCSPGITRHAEQQSPRSPTHPDPTLDSDALRAITSQHSAQHSSQWGAPLDPSPTQPALHSPRTPKPLRNPASAGCTAGQSPLLAPAARMDRWGV